MSNEKGSLNLAGQLLQEMGAKSDPITAGEVNAFRKRPSGPIIPERCVSVERLDIPGEVRLIAVDPYRTNWIVSVFGTSVHLDYQHTSSGRRSLIVIKGAFSDESLNPDRREVRLLGFSLNKSRDYRPILEVTEYCNGHPSAYWFGEERVFEGVERVYSLVRTRDESLIVSVSGGNGARSELRHMTELVGGKTSLIRATDYAFRQLAYDALENTVYGARWFGVTEHGGTIGQEVENILTAQVIAEDTAETYPQELIANDSGVWLTQCASGGDYHLWKVTPRGLVDDTLLRGACGVAMMGAVPVAMIVRRHSQRSWRFYRMPLARAHTPRRFYDPVAEVTDPGFDMLSELFMDGQYPEDGPWYYYGLVGNHLCLMKVPVADNHRAVRYINEL